SGDGDYSDELGHGTQVASVITGTSDEEGVAPDAEIMALKIFDDSGQTTTDIVAEAIRYAVDNGANILNLSFSLYPMNPLILGAIDYALSRNVLIIAAAGNEGSEITYDSLAAQDGIITVGSVDNNGSFSAWSNYGSELDLYAPWDVVAVGGALGEAGTSYSAAFITGLAALILEDNPGMTATEVLYQLEEITKAITPQEYREIMGNKDEAVPLVSMDASTEVNMSAIKNITRPVPRKKRWSGNINEVTSKQDIQRQKESEFTGNPMIMEKFDLLKQGKSTIVPISPFNPIANVNVEKGAYNINGFADQLMKEYMLRKFKEKVNRLKNEIEKKN
ncbi:MAG: S8/S53 family peptidase, partial [Candidatus Omnitrophica bacterium]|nr:S8/S53 family peptidase [Candidatus Omnitrophota bacterium]